MRNTCDVALPPATSVLLSPTPSPPPPPPPFLPSTPLDDSRFEILDPKGCPPPGRKSHPSYRFHMSATMACCSICCQHGDECYCSLLELFCCVFIFVKVSCHNISLYECYSGPLLYFAVNVFSFIVSCCSILLSACRR